MEKSIYNVYVPMESQESCDRMKQLCIDNGLPIWHDDVSFEYLNKGHFFGFSGVDFYVFSSFSTFNYQLIKVTESEFLELLKNTKL